ncbi:hypothetical protein [Litoribrevibacter albus]|uniref:DUF1795 domain-containing protein n=1 Tax=Litoribrevibacter albus TaxID=1473156 RepID=A0AA37S8J0_9GAMM|nr:hypothetical protein [Litoribrevibacter albus]GLQ30376.1 hypothetical protein GCM10007876_08540 [Litoribrevibacter albus]
MNKLLNCFISAFVLLSANAALSSELECDLSSFEGYKQSSLAYTPTSFKKAEVNFQDQAILWNIKTYQIPLDSASSLWNGSNDSYEKKQVIDTVYRNFRFKTLEELLFVKTKLESATEESHFGLEGKEYLISTIYDDRPDTVSKYMLWISSDERNIYFISVVGALLDEEGGHSMKDELQNNFNKFMDSCTVKTYKLPNPKQYD